MEVFTIAPADTKALWLIGLIPLLVLVLVAGVLGASITGARTARFEVATDGLRLRGDWYGRFIPANQLVAAGARRVDLAKTPELLPGRRTMGTSLSGYQAGWFRLRNGDSHDGSALGTAHLDLLVVVLRHGKERSTARTNGAGL